MFRGAVGFLRPTMRRRRSAFAVDHHQQALLLADDRITADSTIVLRIRGRSSEWAWVVSKRTMPRAASPVLLAAVFAGAVAAGQTAPRNTAAPSLAVTRRAAPGPFLAGDEIPVTFAITNVGDAPYVYFARTYDRSGRLPEFELDAFDERGVRAAEPRTTGVGSGGYIGGGLARPETLAPGQSFVQTIALNLWARLDVGRYAVRGIYHTEYRGFAFESPAISVDIVQPAEAARAARIDALRTAWSNATDRSEKQHVLQRWLRKGRECKVVLATIVDEVLP